MPEAITDDPGKFWRQMARIGAMMCLVATFYFPGPRSDNLWQISVSIFAKAYASQIEYLSNFGPHLTFELTVMELTTLLFFPSQLLIGAAVAIIANRRILNEKSHYEWATAILVILTTTAISASTALRSLPHPASHEKIFGIMLGGILLYVFINGLAYVESSHRPRSLDSVLLCLLIPLITATMTWAAQFYSNSGWPVYAGFFGIVYADFGLFMWWRSVKRAAPSDNVQSELVNTPPTC